MKYKNLYWSICFLSSLSFSYAIASQESHDDLRSRNSFNRYYEDKKIEEDKKIKDLYNRHAQNLDNIYQEAHKNQKLNETMYLMTNMKHDGIVSDDLSAIRAALSSYTISQLNDYTRQHKEIYKNIKVNRLLDLIQDMKNNQVIQVSDITPEKIQGLLSFSEISEVDNYVLHYRKIYKAHKLNELTDIIKALNKDGIFQVDSTALTEVQAHASKTNLYMIPDIDDTIQYLRETHKAHKLREAMDLMRNMKNDGIVSDKLEAIELALSSYTISQIDSYIATNKEIYKTLKPEVEPINKPDSAIVQQIIGKIMAEMKIYDDPTDQQIKEIVRQAVKSYGMKEEVAFKGTRIYAALDDE